MECRLKNGDVISAPSLSEFEEAFKKGSANIGELAEEMQFYLQNVWWTETFGKGETIREVLLDTRNKILKRMSEHPENREALEIVIGMIDDRLNNKQNKQ